MQLIDLLAEESLALVTSSRAIARADGRITRLEGRAIAVIVWGSWNLSRREAGAVARWPVSRWPASAWWRSER
jgi:hypothetical protein